jgi:hypothetical protein
MAMILTSGRVLRGAAIVRNPLRYPQLVAAGAPRVANGEHEIGGVEQPFFRDFNYSGLFGSVISSHIPGACAADGSEGGVLREPRAKILWIQLRQFAD